MLLDLTRNEYVADLNDLDKRDFMKIYEISSEKYDEIWRDNALYRSELIKKLYFSLDLQNVECIIQNRSNEKEAYVMIEDSNFDNCYLINLLKPDTRLSIPEWAFSVDDLFEYLQNDFEIKWISDDTHYNIWWTINQMYPGEVENKKGMKEYLKYCKEHGITKEAIEKSCNMECPDLMKLIDRKKGKER